MGSVLTGCVKVEGERRRTAADGRPNREGSDGTALLAVPMKGTGHLRLL